jgi:hypothetical protein
MGSALADKLAAEEFKQIHQDLKQREGAVQQVLNITVTGTTTLLTLCAAFVFQIHPSELICTITHLSFPFHF